MPPTVVFIHGAWVSPKCWTGFIKKFEEAGWSCLAPGWPYDDRSVPELQSTPDPSLATVGIAEIVAHYAGIIKALPEPPLLVGHSFGGLFVQLLLDMGLGAAGIAIDSAPPKGVLPTLPAIRAASFVFKTWASWKKTIVMPFKAFQWGFAHTLELGQQRGAYKAQIVPTPGRIYLQSFLGQHTTVNFANDNRKPLLLIAGSVDRTVTASMVRALYQRHRRSKAVTEFKEFPNRPHWLIASPGWEEVASYGINWASLQLSGC